MQMGASAKPSFTARASWLRAVTVKSTSEAP